MSGNARCPACGQPTDQVNASTAARILGVTEGYVRQLLAKGRLPNSTKSEGKQGRGVWQVPLSSLEGYMAARDAR
jgi:hypothetical protein